PLIQASTPCLEPPAWALAQRSLFTLPDEGWRRFAALYTRPDGSLRYAGRLTSRDGARSVVVQAGAFGQHDIASVSYDGAEPGWAGSDTEYIPRDVRGTAATAEVGGP